MSKEVRIGIIAIISGLILYYGFSFLKGSDVFSRTNYYFAVYNNVGSLATSNLVKINGVPVGRVTRIDLLQSTSNKVLVEFDVKENVVLGEGTIAELTSDLLGGTSIILRIGDITQPMTSGDTITSRVDKGLEEILESARPAANNLNLAINKLDRLLEEFEGIGIQLKQTISGLDTTRYILNRTLSSTNSLVNETGGLIQSINDRVGQLEPILAKADAVMDSVDAAAIGKTLDEVRKLTEQLGGVMADLNAGEGTMGKLLTEDSLYNNLNVLLLDVDSLVNHFNEYPKDFLKPLGRKNKKMKGLPQGN